MAVLDVVLAVQNSVAAVFAADSASVSAFSLAVTLACAALSEESALSPLHPVRASRTPATASARCRAWG